MNFSERINKLIESDKFYEQLIDDPTVSVLFGLCQVHVLKELLKEHEKFREDLKKGILHEIPDYNVDDIKNFLNRQRTSKLRRDAEELSKTVIEAFPDSPMAGEYRALADAVLEAAGGAV